MDSNRIGSYEILAKLGEGGMGEVYRARDTRLGRQVALKMLLPAVASDADRLARFEREAQTLASLNHLNIAQLFGIEEGADGSFLVMELVEGPTLADRIADGALPLDEALAIATQIADALEAAHERGIIHRDLKPANIKVRSDGVVKVLDFGLAKAIDPPDPQSRRGATAPTMSSPAVMTGVGVILGTATYMSPEQARGFPVDQRADIWAFGCVLYEMLTGRAPFGGATVSDVIAAIIEREPVWTPLPAATPESVRRLLRRCLVKDAKRRLHHIADARIELTDLAGANVSAVAPAPSAARLPWVIAAVAIVIASAAIGWLLTRRQSASATGGIGADARLERLTYDPGSTGMPAVSPDGRLLAYASDRAGNGDLDIWVQQMSGGTALRLTDDPSDDSAPDFSADGSQVVFRSERNGGGIYVVSALGGPARLVAQEGRGPRFSPDGSRIAYWAGSFRGLDSNRSSRAFVVALSGADPIPLLPDFEVATDPIWSPDGRSLIVAARKQLLSDKEPLDWWVVPLNGDAPVKTGILALPVFRNAITTCGRWTAQGVVFSSAGDLWTIRLSDKGLIEGAPRRLTFGVGPYEAPATGPNGQIVFAHSVSQRLVERASLSRVTEPPARLYADSSSIMLRASTTRDGSLILLERQVGDSREIWAKNVRSGHQELIVSLHGSAQADPVISPDGARIAYTMDPNAPNSNGTAARTGYVVESAGGVPRKICDACGLSGFLSDNYRLLASSDDGRAIRLIDTRDGTTRDLVTVSDGSRLNRPHASDDDRWLAFRRNVNTGGKSYVVRLSTDRPATVDESVMIDEPTTTGRPCGWSLDSHVLYLLLDTDGFRCIWGQPLDANGKPVGKPSVVRHFHTTVGMSSSFGNAVNADGFVYEAADRTSNIWKMTPSRAE